MTAVLVLGGGMREHAVIRVLARSPAVTRLYTMPPAFHIEREVVRSTGHPVQGVPGKCSAPGDVFKAVRDAAIDLVVIGTAEPSACGVADMLRENKVAVCGVGRQAVRLEQSKEFGAEFMHRHGIPAPRSAVFTDPEDAIAYARTRPAGCAVKDNGFADGAGVMVCRTEAQAVAAVRRFFAAAVEKVVIQDRCEGPEFSVHAIVSDGAFALLPSAQDYKRLLDGDLGPNTGGLGAVSPVPWLDHDRYQELAADLVSKFVAGCLADGIGYRGIVYFPVMLTPDGPRVLEINVRFGNPEAQSIMARLADDPLPLLLGCAQGNLDGPDLLPGLPVSAVTVAAFASGYPGRPASPFRITGLNHALQNGVQLSVSSGVTSAGGECLGQTGRALTITATADTLARARRAAYQGLRPISFPGMCYRTDVGGPPSSHDGGNGAGVLVLTGADERTRRRVAESIARQAGRAVVIDRSQTSDLASACRRWLLAGKLVIVPTGPGPGADDVCAHVAEVPLGSDPGGDTDELARWALVRAFSPASPGAGV